MFDRQTCNVAHGTQILCKHEHEVEANTTFSCKERNLRKHVFCSASHGGKGPLPCDNLDIGNVQNDIGMHAQADQAFSVAVIKKSIYIRTYIERCNVTTKHGVQMRKLITPWTREASNSQQKEIDKMLLKSTRQNTTI